MSAIEILAVDHVVLRVRDVERALRFYRDVLHCAEERRIEALGLYQLRAGRSLIDLVDVAGPLGKLGGPPPGETARNLDHFALQLASMPLSTSIWSRNGASGSRIGESSKFVPSPSGVQYSIAIPFGT